MEIIIMGSNDKHNRQIEGLVKYIQDFDQMVNKMRSYHQDACVPQYISLALFDVLGFSNRVHKNGLGEIYTKYRQLIDMVNSVQKSYTPYSLNINGAVAPAPELNKDGSIHINTYIDHTGFPILKKDDTGQLVINKEENPYKTLNIAYFSDTILLWTAYSVCATRDFLQTCKMFFISALRIELPLRGCITFGNTIFDVEKNIFLGEPLVNAAKGEASQNWVGVSFAGVLPSGLFMDESDYIPYTDHIKPNKEEHVLPIALDWPRYHSEQYSEPNAYTLLDRLNTDERFASYYNNAIKFCDYSRNNREWYIKQEKKVLLQIQER